MTQTLLRHALATTIAVALCGGCGDGGSSGTGGSGGTAGTGGTGASTGMNDPDDLTTQDVLGLLGASDATPLVAAEAYVSAPSRPYRFELQLLERAESGLDSDVLVGGCTVVLENAGATFSADFAESSRRDSGDRFSIWTPDPFPPSSNGETLTGAGVALGLFEFGSGERWRPVPGGSSEMGCVLDEQLSEEGKPVFTCKVAWAGLMAPDFSPDPPAPGAALVTCTFAPKDSTFTQCLQDCDDDNPCTFDACTPECNHVPLEDALVPRIFDPMGQNVLELLERFSRGCEFDDGTTGLCSNGECLEDPCDGSCDTSGFYDSEEDECIFEICIQPTAECDRVTIEACSVGTTPF